MLGSNVRQNHKTLMMNANDLHDIGSVHRREENLSPKRLVEFFRLESTVELIEVICLEEDITLDQVKKSASGRYGGTWVHPLLLVKLGMWYSPKFEVRVLKWAMDNLCMARDDSGDTNKAMNVALDESYPEEMKRPYAYASVARKIADACGVCTSKDKWEKATEDQLKLRTKIQDNIIVLAGMASNAGECVTLAVRKTRI